MGEKSFLTRLKFSPIFWGIALGGIYIASTWRFYASNPQPDTKTLILDIFVNHIIPHFFVYLILLLLWVFFFGQFILPIRTNENRQKIFERLLARMFSGDSGPALFIRDGRLVESEGESQKSGAGVIVLDSASAVVMKKFGKYTQVAGPGVLFTDKGETIAEEPVPLQKLIDSAGPKETDDPFAPKDSYNTPEEFKAVQDRRFTTRAMTRDAIEIVPIISIIFKIDADPAVGDEIGSRFGYNEEAVRKAIWHTGVDTSNNKHETISWTKLPINIAVDIWREYLAKYRFDELFTATQDIRSKEEPKSEKEPEVHHEPPPQYEYQLRGMICDLLLTVNAYLKKILDEMENRLSPPIQDEEKKIEDPAAPATKKIPPEKETALQSIQRYMNERLKNEEYTPLDRYGKPIPGPKRTSLEYKFLTKERGIRIISVSIKDLLFANSLEDKLLVSWGDSWLKNAKDEKAFIEKHNKIREAKGRELALLAYAEAISKEINRKKTENSTEALQRLLRITRRALIRNEQLLKEAEREIDSLSDMIQWVDKANEPTDKGDGPDAVG